MVPTGRTEIMFATNRFNRVSVALPVERNSGMDRCGLTNLTAACNEFRAICAIMTAAQSADAIASVPDLIATARSGLSAGRLRPKRPGAGQSFVALAENPLVNEPEVLPAIMGAIVRMFYREPMP
jgi:hypothetical protein